MLTWASFRAQKQLDSKCSRMKLDAQNNSANIDVDWTSVTWRANQICPERTISMILKFHFQESNSVIVGRI